MGALPVGRTEVVAQHRIVSIERLRDLKAGLEALAASGLLSDNTVFRGYLDGFEYAAPASVPRARSIVVLAVPSPLMFVRFHSGGRVYEVMMPPQYCSSGVSAEELRDAALAAVGGGEGVVLERGRAPQLKSLAVRSGLRRYGRNSLCYVDGMGSFLALHAYFTDAERSNDAWGEAETMPTCEGCELCADACPSGSIAADRPLVDAGKCLTLYNEIQGEFPEWLDPGFHNALVGCMRCQLCCPANREVIASAGRLEDVTEEETARILDGRPDAGLLNSLSAKLRRCGLVQSDENFPVLTRNLKALVARP